MNILDENIPKPQRELLLPIPEGSDSDKETIGALAKAANVHIETVRYYQRRGLLAV